MVRAMGGEFGGGVREGGRGCTKCPLCSPRIGKMPCRAWFVCVTESVCVCERLSVCLRVGATPVRRA